MQEVSNTIWSSIDARIEEVVSFLTHGGQDCDHFETPLTLGANFHLEEGPMFIFDLRPQKWRIEGDFGLVVYKCDKDAWANDGALRKLVLYYVPDKSLFTKEKPFEVASVYYIKRNSTDKVFREIALCQTIEESRVFSFDSVKSFERVCTKAIKFALVVAETIESATLMKKP
jgi:hypothetical protein